MRAIAFMLAWLAFAGHGRRVQRSTHRNMQKVTARNTELKPCEIGVHHLRELLDLVLAFSPDAGWQFAGACGGIARMRSNRAKMAVGDDLHHLGMAFGDDWVQTTVEPPSLFEPLQPEVLNLLRELNLSKTELYKGAGLWESSDVAKLSKVGGSEPELDSLKREVLARVRSGAVPMLGLLMIKDGDVVCSVAAGEASDGQPLTSKSLLRFYSMTKPIVSLAALMLVEEGKLDLDGRISQYLRCWDDESIEVLAGGSPEGKSEHAHKPITIRMLLTHTSGLTYGFIGSSSEVSELYRMRALELPHPLTEHVEQSEPEAQSLYDWAGRLNDLPLATQPGATFEYGHSTDLLGAVIEQVTRESLGSFLHRRIFEPLGMHDTGFTITASDLHRFATCYRATGLGEWRHADYPPYAIAATDETSPWIEGRVQGRVPSGGAGLISTAEDYARFTQCLANGGELDGHRLLSEAMLEEATTDALAPMGARRAGIVEAAYEGFGLLGGVTTTDQAPRGFLPAGAACSPGTVAWGGAAGTYFFVDRANCLSCVIYTQLLDYGIGAPDLRPALCRAACRIFPHMRLKLDAAEPRSQAGSEENEAQEDLVQGFTG